MEEQQQLPKTNAEWANYYESIIAELSDNQKKIGEPISTNMWNLENAEKQMQFLREEVKSLIAKAKAKREKANY